MNLTDLKQSVSIMSDDELMNLIRDIRTTRRIPKETKTARKTAPKKASKPMDLDTLLAGASPEMIDALLSQMEK